MPTDAELQAAYDEAVPLSAAAKAAKARADAKDLIELLQTDAGRALRAIASLLRKQFNVVRQRDRDRNTALQNGATLAAIKTAWHVNNLPALNDFSWADVIGALKSEVDANV